MTSNHNGWHIYHLNGNESDSKPGNLIRARKKLTEEQLQQMYEKLKPYLAERVIVKS